MRYLTGFGLLSLLVGVAVYVFVFSKTEIPKIQKGEEVKQELQPITGQTADGQSAQNSVKLEGAYNGSQLTSLNVTDVTPNGYFEQNFGLKKGDKITAVGELEVGALGDENSASGMVWQAGQGKSLTVNRNGQKLTLNAADGSLHKGGNLQKIGGVSIPTIPGQQ